ncbi:MAG: aldehyde ferredoxin oxidoreductase N-terminal domain-containing protein [Thermoleophilia bacterium]
MYLYNEKLLVVDLAAGSVKVELLADDLAEGSIGGAGLAAALLERHTDGAPVVFATGPLTGTLFPGGALAVLSRKQATGELVHATLTLFMGSELKYAGFDALIIKGVSPRPVYLWVHDGLASLQDASALAGLDTWETSDAIKHDKGDDVVQVLAMGPAGEAGSTGGQVVANYWATADRAGFGGVLGSKGLKAIALRGLGLIDVEEPEDLLEHSLELGAKAAASAPAHGVGGADPALREWLAPFIHRHRGCYSCALACFTYLKYNEDPSMMASALEEPGFLVTDAEALEVMRAGGLSAEGALRLLEAAARRGLAPLPVALLAAEHGSVDLSLLAEVEGQDHTPETAAPASATAALGYLVGVCPTSLAAAPTITELDLREALRLGSGLELQAGELAGRLPVGLSVLADGS